MHVKAKRKTR